jgi:hypothetical protein
MWRLKLAGMKAVEQKVSNPLFRPRGAPPAVRVFGFEPIRGVARPVPGTEPLRDNALQVKSTRMLEYKLAVELQVLIQLDARLRVRKQIHHRRRLRHESLANP